MARTSVLITRPEEESTLLAASLHKRGIRAVCIPAFRFEPGPAGLNMAGMWVNGTRRLAIFSSPRAVEFGLKLLPNGFLEGAEIAAIGPATRDRLEAAGRHVSIVPELEFNSESLLQQPSLQTDPGTAIVFAAPGGRQRLFLGLAALGWKTRFAHVYRAVPLQPPKQETQVLLDAEHIVSLWTSSNTLDHLAGHLDGIAWERVCKGNFIVTSERLAELASHYCKGQISVADGPGNDALLSAVLSAGVI